MSDRCPYCSFQPESLSDYCPEHDPRKPSEVERLTAEVERWREVGGRMQTCLQPPGSPPPGSFPTLCDWIIDETMKWQDALKVEVAQLRADAERLDRLQRLVYYEEDVLPDHESDARFDPMGELETPLIDAQGDLRKAIDLLPTSASEEGPTERRDGMTAGYGALTRADDERDNELRRIV